MAEDMRWSVMPLRNHSMRAENYPFMGVFMTDFNSLIRGCFEQLNSLHERGYSIRIVRSISFSRHSEHSEMPPVGTFTILEINKFAVKISAKHGIFFWKVASQRSLRIIRIRLDPMGRNLTLELGEVIIGEYGKPLKPLNRFGSA